MGRRGKMNGKYSGKKGMDACSSSWLESKGSLQVLDSPRHGKAQQHLPSRHGRNKQQGPRTSTETTSLGWYLQRSCQNMMVNSYTLKNKDPLNIKRCFNLLQNPGMKFNFLSPLNCDKLPAKATLEKLAWFL